MDKNKCPFSLSDAISFSDVITVLVVKTYKYSRTYLYMNKLSVYDILDVR